MRQRRVTDVAEFFLGCAVAGVMSLAGAAKLLDPGPAILFMNIAYKMPVARSEFVVYSLGAIEILAAICLAAGIARWRWPIITTLILVALFIGALIDIHFRHPNVGISCGCFGKLQAPVGGNSLLSHLALNFAASACLIVLIFIAQRRRAR